MLALEPIPRVITFDCYATLVQWSQALREAGRAILSSQRQNDKTERDAAKLANRLREVAMVEQQRQPFRDYVAILHLSLDQTLAELGYEAREGDHELLLSALRTIGPHPDVPSALSRLRDRYRLAIVSNTDDDLIAGTVAAIGIPIDFVVTSQQAQAYKPDHRLFLHAHAAMGVTMEQTIHVGMGQFTDMKVCHELGIRSVRIDRANEMLHPDAPPNPDWPPHAVLPDLSRLPDLLLPS
jgi:2-haloacid dehalogenase